MAAEPAHRLLAGTAFPQVRQRRIEPRGERANGRRIPRVVVRRDRDRREPILAAVRRAVLRTQPAPEAPDLVELLRHPAIANRLRARWNRWEDMLAETVAADVGAEPHDPEPRVVAAALIGAIRVAATAVDGQPHRHADIARRVFDLLASGLSEYGRE